MHRRKQAGGKARLRRSFSTGKRRSPARAWAAGRKTAEELARMTPALMLSWVILRSKPGRRAWRAPPKRKEQPLFEQVGVLKLRLNLVKRFLGRHIVGFQRAKHIADDLAYSALLK